MAQDLSQLTDMWMVNPTMFDPTQQSNQFSNYNNAALPWPPTYNGAPVNAATGQPIPSFQAWQAANPGGVSLNATPAQPQAAAPPTNGAFSPQQAGRLLNATGQWGLTGQGGNGMGGVNNQVALDRFNQLTAGYGAQPQASSVTGAQGGAAQGGAAPNNWQAAINALANPGHVQTMGAQVPLVQGYQPSGGINAAFLQNAQGRPNMNQGFLSALAALQNRPGQ